MKEGPFFSVIIPAHNAEGYIRKGLESILEQDFTDYELIVICDSCTDKTEEVAAQYTHLVFRTNFHSAGGGRNAGLDVARGEWILFMDDDDWYLPGAFRKIAETIKQNTEIDICCFGFEWKGRGTALQSRQRMLPAVWNKAWRRDFIGSKRFPIWMHTEDVEFNKRVMPGAWCAYVMEPVYYYNFMRKGSISDRIRDGEMGYEGIPEEGRKAAAGYERWLKSKEFNS